MRDVPVEVSVVGTPGGRVRREGRARRPIRRRCARTGPKSEVLVLQHARADAFDVTGLTEGEVHAPARDRQAAGPGHLRRAERARRRSRSRARWSSGRSRSCPSPSSGQPKAKTQPAEVDVRLTCPPEIVRALRPEQVVPQVEVTSKDPSGSESLPVEVSVDKCEAHVTPATVIVKW